MNKKFTMTTIIAGLLCMFAVTSSQAMWQHQTKAGITFRNETSKLETLNTLVTIGDYLDKAHTGLYTLDFLPSKATINRPSYRFDPLAYVKAVATGFKTLPFFFTKNGEFYYLILSSVTGKYEQIAEQQGVKFVAGIIQIADIQSKAKSAKIIEVATIGFNDNDKLEITLTDSGINLRNKTAGKAAGEPVKLSTSIKPVAKPKTPSVPEQPKKPSLVPMTKPAPAAAPRNSIVPAEIAPTEAIEPIEPVRAEIAKPKPVRLTPKTLPKPVSAPKL